METMELIRISDMNISEITESELEAGLRSVLIQRKDAIESIYQSMINADEAWLKYKNEEFEPTEEEAKTDRATLNKAEKNIAEKYAELKAAYDKPLQNIEANIKSIRSAIKTASGVVDQSVKDYENKQKTKKMTEIQAYFDSKEFKLFPIDKIFDSRWLNKTFKISDVKKELDRIIAEIYTNIKVLENIPDHGVMAKAIYLEKLDIGEAMRQVEILKQNAEKLAREKIAREERELKEQVKVNEKEEIAERKEEIKQDQHREEAAQFYDSLGIKTEPVEEKPEILEYTLKIRGTKEQLFDLRAYMTSRGIAYEKIE
jgi:hypothetical protein